MSPRSFLIFCFLAVFLLVGLVSAQGVSKTGKKDGTALYKAAKTLPSDTYEFRSAISKKSLTFVSSGNIVTPRKSGQKIWGVKRYKKTKYFTARGKNKAGLEKCISTRWTVTKKGGYPDAAVLWQCEVDTKKHDTGGYEPIKTPKQLWLAVPDKKYEGYYKIVSASHLYDMIPRCIAASGINGGTKLTKCKVNTENKSLLWKLVRK